MSKLTESQAWAKLARAFTGTAKFNNDYCVPVWAFNGTFISGLCDATNVLLGRLIDADVYHSMRARFYEMPRNEGAFVWPPGDGKSRATFCRKQARLTNDGIIPNSEHQIAEEVYRLADAMLAARGKA